MAAKSRRVSELEKIREAAFIVVAEVLIDRLVGSDVYLWQNRLLTKPLE